ncbi:acyltransferase [Alteromonas sp. KUL49]|uniref:acyltransferase n=1 Tax=Alteromonas sp. KUL49 TaxID=2480798 RepID=UPI00102F09D9|nr:acyltransferase [Alteromonas sp. KUL49]TAP34968.1 acyltransferase [Alteromonas sp. KUL49]GEA13512.1 phospholipid/glycerol acyltransferase [Alteromonas sp. KUL49]
MIRTLLSPLVFVVHTTLQIANLALWGGLVIIFGLIKLLPLGQKVRLFWNGLMHAFMFSFGKVSVFFIRVFNAVDIECAVHGELSKNKWYLIIANHLSYLDIVLLIEFAANRIPAPKFFLKKELIWLPFVGLAAWALDMPFMQRYTRAYLEKHPEKRGKDLETTKASCEKFRTVPTTVINFVEGTRFTEQKHLAKQSPYQHLLPPKAGGVSFTMGAMGHLFTNVLDISLLYPENKKHPMMAMLSGTMTKIIIDVNVTPVPETQVVESGPTAREQIQKWLNNLWKNKDSTIANLLN